MNRALAGAVVVALGGVIAVPAVADHRSNQDVRGTFVTLPDQGPPGTLIDFIGEGCFGSSGAASVLVELLPAARGGAVASAPDTSPLPAIVFDCTLTLLSKDLN